jgi:hypothetical protein
MANLTEVSAVSRKIIKFGTAGLVFLMILPILTRVAKVIYYRYNPPPVPPPTVTYGKIPAVVFPIVEGAKRPEIVLETISGGLPRFQDRANVYPVEINKSRLLTLERYREKAKSLRINSEPIRVDDRTYRFIHATEPVVLEVDLITNVVSYKYDWTTDVTMMEKGTIPRGEEAVNEAKSFFSRIGLLTDDLAVGTAKYKYLTATGSALVPAPEVAEANFVRVDLFRADKDKIKVVTAGGETSPVYALISAKSRDGIRVVQASYQYSQLVSGTSVATYPLKPITTAWNELTSGGGFIVKSVLPKEYVRKISLAYYESNEPQDYLQPVYVFEGDAGFTAYVSAIDPETLIELRPK